MAKDFYLYPNWSDNELRDWMATLENKRGNFTPMKLKAFGWVDLTFILLIVLALCVFFGNWGLHSMMDDAWDENHILSLLTTEAYLVFFIWFTGLFTIGVRMDEIRQYYTFKKVLNIRMKNERVLSPESN